MFTAPGNNCFWLSPEASEYPKLSLLVKADLATLLYFPTDGHPGFRSVGNVPDLEAGETTVFSTSNYPPDDVEILNDAIVTFSTALKAAKEFSASAGLPPSVEWFEL
jgi:hypothetical protein